MSRKTGQVHSPDGTDLRYLTHYQGGQVNAFVGSYSPDGRWIVLRLESHGSYGLYRMRPDANALQSSGSRASSRGSSPGDHEPAKQTAKVERSICEL